jgi:hypothetical protein
MDNKKNNSPSIPNIRNLINLSNYLDNNSKKNKKKSEKAIISNLAKLDSNLIIENEFKKKNIKNYKFNNDKYIECYSND